MKRNILFLISIFIFVNVNAQNFQRLIISTVRTGDGMYDFYAENPNIYPLQLSLTFTEFDNMTSTCPLPYIGTIKNGKHKIFEIRRLILDIPGAFKYTHFTRVGAYPVVYDAETTYRLPVAIGKTTKAMKFDLSKSDDPEKIMWGFSFEPFDTVYATREGVVCMRTESQYTNGFKSGENALTILHPDYSFGKYEALADSQLFVSIGDTIKAGDAIGLAGGEKYAVGAHIRFTVYYVNARIDDIDNKQIRNFHTYVDPLFRTKGNKQVTVKENQIFIAE
jgi:hypothetical protein